MVKTSKAAVLPAANTGFKVMDENAAVGMKPTAKKAGIVTRAALKEMTNQVIKPSTAIEKKDLKSTVKSSVPKKAETKSATVSRLRKDPTKSAPVMKPKTVKSEMPVETKACDPMDVDAMDIEEFEQPSKKIKNNRPLNPTLDPFRAIPADIQDIDVQDIGDPQFCTEYVPFIFAFLREKEISDRIDSNYMEEQTEIVARHREILVDWMAEVSVKFKFLSETLFIAVGIVDRFLARSKIPKTQLQLVGITALFIASKFEEIVTPEVNDFVFITASAYTREEIVSMEKQILVVLDFNVTFPIALTFLRRFSKAASSDSSLHTLSKYLTELSILDYSLLKFLPSEIAAAAVYLARAMNQHPVWEKTVEFYSGFTEAEVLPCARKLNDLLKNQSSSKHRSIWTKYSSATFLKVALIPAVDI